MSEYTTRQILDMIEANEGPEGLDLSKRDIRSIDLSRETIQAELARVRHKDAEAEPEWVSADSIEGAGGVNLRGTCFQSALGGRANLRGACLRKANLRGAYLARADLQKADLTEADLQEVNLRQANLHGVHLWKANLRQAVLEAANLQGAVLQEADLQAANLREASLQEAQLWKAHLRNAVLKRANFWGAMLMSADLKQADLEGANLQAWLQGADLQGAVLWEANLRGAILVRANLQEADLRRADLQGAFFAGASLDHTEMDRSSIGLAVGEERAGWYYEARDAYLRLKQNFDGLGDYAASAWAYQKERQMEKACNAPWRARGIYGKTILGDTSKHRVPAWHPKVWWFYARHTVKWLSDWFVECLCGYGESLLRVLFWMFANLFGFAAYYWRIGGVWLVEPSGGAKVATLFWHYLIYSAGAFTTTEFARFQAADDRVRMVTAIQAIIGIVLAGLLGFVAGNRIRRS